MKFVGGTITQRNHFLYEGNRVRYAVFGFFAVSISAFFFMTMYTIPAEGLFFSAKVLKSSVFRTLILMTFQILAELYFDDIRQGVFDELQEYSERTERATKAKEVFFACMSHEIRNPLQCLLGSVDLLQQSTDKAHRDSYVKIIKNGCEVVLNLVSNILDVSKIEAKKMELAAHPSDLSENISKIVRLLSERATGKGLALSCKEASEIPPCLLFDPHRLQQVVINLLSNAIKFTQRGRVLVTVSWVPLKESEDAKAAIEREFGASDWKNTLYPLLEVEDEKEEYQKRMKICSSCRRVASGLVFFSSVAQPAAARPVSQKSDNEDDGDDSGGMRHLTGGNVTPRKPRQAATTHQSPVMSPMLREVKEEMSAISEGPSPRREIPAFALPAPADKSGNLAVPPIITKRRTSAVMLCQKVIKGLVKIQVMDTGIGIRKEGLDRLFKPYQQADATISQ